MAGPAGFVGREGELSRLLGALGGDARLVLVVGDAGVGKTRFVTEGTDRAAAAMLPRRATSRSRRSRPTSSASLPLVIS